MEQKFSASVERAYDACKFVDGKALLTVNPSLRRHAVLDAHIGLFDGRQVLHPRCRPE